MKRVYLFAILLIITLPSWSQIAPGDWDFHLSMINTKQVVQAGQKIYFLSEGGIYYFNKKDNSIETFTKKDSLSGSDFMGISYNEATRSVVVTYKNSCIDVIRENNKVYPILDIKRKNISGDKLIYNMTHNGKYCYMACGFGIVVVDLEKLEIKDSYIIGNNGNNLPVYDVAFKDDSIYAGTKEGIKYAPLEGVNLLDYSNWNNVENIFLNDYNYNILETGWNRLWAIHNSELWHGDRTVSRHGAGVWYPEFDEYVVIRDFKIINDHLIYCDDKPEVIINEKMENEVVHHASIVVYNPQKEKLFNPITSYPFAKEGIAIQPLSAIIDDQGILWIADGNYGGVRYENGNFTQLTPEGPFNNYVYSLTFSDGVLWSTTGGHTNAWGNMWFDFNFNEFKDGHWKSYNRHNGAVDDYFRDAFQVLPLPGNPSKYYVATWGGGLLEFENGAFKKVYNDENSTLQNVIAGDYYTRVGGMDFDSKGNLWMSNSMSGKSLHKMTPSGDWEGFYLPEIASIYNLGSVMVTQNDDIWLIVPHLKTLGIYVMSNDGSKKKHLDVTARFTNGVEEKITPMNDVYSFIQDKEGAVWVGTSNGIAVYFDPESVFDVSPLYADQPGLDLNDGIYHPLLENVTVTAIAVDGGNRKWCGTKGDGLFLISDDGQQELAHFTIENSPLISDEITSLAYDGKTGILYIGTQLGLVSYRTDSKDSEGSFGKVYAYPNPVRENYKGDIYITGLVYDTNVKITTVSGRLVYETTSNGGQAVWNGKDLAGNRVHTGVYLAFCTAPDGTESEVAKILFIR